MKLKDSVTKEKLEELGFNFESFGLLDEYSLFVESSSKGCGVEIEFYISNNPTKLGVDREIEISMVGNDIDEKDCILNLDILLKMFKLGYIEESEEQ